MLVLFAIVTAETDPRKNCIVRIDMFDARGSFIRDLAVLATCMGS